MIYESNRRYLTNTIIDTGDNQIEYHHYKISISFSGNLSLVVALSTKYQFYAKVFLALVTKSFSIFL